MIKAVFLDRDGVINDNTKYYVWRIEDFTFNPGVLEALKILQNKGFLLFIISNQSGIAKGLYTIDDVEKLHGSMKEALRDYGIEIKDIFYCTHHPDHGNCLCRKPDSLLLEKAIARYDIDVSSSFLIGDSERDIIAGAKAGLIGILMKPNDNLMGYIRNLM